MVDMVVMSLLMSEKCFRVLFFKGSVDFELIVSVSFSSHIGRPAQTVL